jgi:tetratricopeptide (TPR) repeat protein
LIERGNNAKVFMSKKYWETYFSAIKKQDWDQARVSLENLASTDQNNPHVQLKLGDIYQRTGKTAQAINAYHKSAWVLTKQGFAQKALALYKIILRLDSYNEEAINRSNELMIGIESAKKQRQTTVPFVTKFGETSDQKEEAVHGLPLETEEDTDRAFQPSVDMSDVIDRTSYRDMPSEATVPPEIPEQKDSDIQPKDETADTSRIEEEPEARIPSFFSSLSEDEVQYLIYKTDSHTFSPGQLILEEGDSGDSVFFIKSGHAKVISHILGKEIELATLSPGDVFGEVAFLTGRPRTASVSALEKLEVIEFKKLLLEEIFERYPSTLEKLHDFYHCRIEDTLRTVKNKMKKQDM